MKKTIKKYSGFSVQPGAIKTAKKIIDRSKAKNRDKSKVKKNK